MKHEEDISRLSFILCFFNLFRGLCNRYPCVTEVILYNIRIITYHIDVLLQKYFKFLYNEILVFVLLFLDEFLKYTKVLLNRVKVRRVR